MDKEVQKLRELAKAFREMADATDKVADVTENPDSTQQEQEEAMKDYLWKAMKIQGLQ
jgi:hypothetical protein